MIQVAGRRKSDLPYEKPNKDGNVWPRQCCPAFSPRRNAPEGLKQCWYCIYAEFHLDKSRPLEVGICNWPIKTDEKSIQRKEG